MSGYLRCLFAYITFRNKYQCKKNVLLNGSVLSAALSLFSAGFCSGRIIPQLYRTCYYQISPLLRILCSTDCTFLPTILDNLSIPTSWGRRPKKASNI